LVKETILFMIKAKLKKIIFKVIFSIAATLAVLSFIFYGPYEFVRETWVTSAMTTMTHQWFATTLYDKATINKILDKHSIIMPTDTTDPSLIHIKEKINNKVELVDVSTSNFRAYLLKVYNPAKIRLVPCKNIGQQGQKLNEILKEHSAIAGINGSGFVDGNGHTKGGTPSGLIMVDKKILYSQDGEGKKSIVGIDVNSKLILGNFNNEELLKSNIRDAVSFSPLLIINGKPTVINGNGGWGIAPRTAIGQTKDGVMLLLVVDGRQLSSFGATVKDIQDIFIKEGAVNASNLDGGSSSIMMLDGKTVNFPCTSKTGRYVPSAFIVTE
jgi:exopolysaccharide biosynthesis protein